MSTTNNTSQNEFEATRGWHNIGICKQFARDNIPFRLRNLYLELVEDSFGFCQRTTMKKTQAKFGKEYGISDRTFRDQVKELENLGLLKRVESSKFVEGGGSEAYAYAPAYPKGYGKLFFKDEQKESSNTKSKVPDKKEVTSYKNMYF